MKKNYFDAIGLCLIVKGILMKLHKKGLMAEKSISDLSISRMSLESRVLFSCYS